MTQIDNEAGPPPGTSSGPTNATWTCPRCRQVISGLAPDHRLCDDCLSDLALAGYEPAPGAPYGDLPPCPHCGGEMVEVVRLD